MEKFKHVLFDLDGTLLPMKQEEFVTYYMPLLAEAYLKKGFKGDVREFIGQVWKSYYAMVKNDGSCTNEEAFWREMVSVLPLRMEEAKEIAEEFYSGEFNRAIVSTQPTVLSDRIVKTAKQKGAEVYLATNPIFPECATRNRIRWAGLDAEDFRLITTYESYCYCKPNINYFREILNEFDLCPQECLMVGNDVEEDLAVRVLGVKTYLVTDCIENPKNLPIETDYQGTLEELLAQIEAWPERNEA